ncbi:membrane-bound PQQ-dependent dehydrogenase, glucose/quinate/shikimate family [Chromohalobacter israelensis]|uniref:membrane-bound PQQ-dependent dehydrogenase, glucose/quinate/shikimate family n=1 Tax=Chromohalobacter israelensis TaxID=141390 RepID=UPI000A029881|nr:membrane-bound PQQ-dependent dehydrogenase, glucose/quinate/shikimate family [Chromohalobacter israelensis]MBZ5876863.1 membrane-bound PQQ-dependent dehydrogenase, glucose/quinate/shikimate family [Chromohalobacter salexigens]MDF9434270.1 membrane-bound PQQ-dependent dehydrogenase, glucose/quinate/shikimate family [Chromohalobacter israelensis]
MSEVRDHDHSRRNDLATSTSSRGAGGLFAKLVGIIVALVGLALGGGGLYLAVLGGSWYYLIAGALMLVSGIQLLRGRMSGAWLYGLAFVGTLIWAAWESGLNYWRWIPRLDVALILAILVALIMPTLKGGPSRKASLSVAGVLCLGLIVAGALAFVPRGYQQFAEVPAAAESTLATDVGDAQPADTPDAGDWVAYGRDSAATRYSPLDQVTPENVGDLEVAWQYRTGDLLDHRWGAETTPLKVGDDVFLCTSRNILISLDAASGEENWRYDPQVSEDAIPYTAACRGVTYYEVPDERLDELADTDGDTQHCRARIISGTLDGRMLEVDAATGEPCTGFGDDGQVDIKENMGETPDGYVSINSAPVVVRDVVVTGHQVLDGQRRYPPSGVIKGFDAVTGELEWAWDAARPDRSEPLSGDETYTRGSPNMWTTAAGDSKLGLVYLPMANSAADYWSSSRTPEENEWASSMVALNVETGLPEWHFQTAHKDVWDYDPGSQPTLIDFPTDEGEVPALVMPTKQGEIYVFNRETGELLGGGAEERPVPQGGAEPEERSKTQPFSNYATLRQPDIDEKDMWGMSPFDQLFCRIQYQQASWKGMYTPPTADQPWIQYTGYNGGSDWGSVAIDPRRGVMIANYNDMPNYNELVPRAVADAKGWKPREELESDSGGAEGAGDPQANTPYAINVNAGWRVPYTGLLCKQPPYGHIRAIELASGDTLWDRPLGTARANGPWGIRSGLPIDIGTPNNGGSVVTAGGLIFIAAATDDLIRAIDIESGETVWQAPLPAGGQANPMVYEANGRQYLVIVATGHHFMQTPSGDYVIAYALPDDA